MTIRSAHTSHTTWSPHSNSRIFISLRQQLIKKRVIACCHILSES
eukprot:09193.XXX_415006_414063_1 [CDS] Oithona nana genome sequencing.